MNDVESAEQSEQRPRRILITGAAGRIGAGFARAAHERYRLRLMVQRAEDAGRAELHGLGEVVQADLADLPRLKECCREVDTVLHLAADPNPSAGWDSLLHNNIVGTYNVCVAAKAAGCRRLIVASSIHAVSGYPLGRQIRTDDPVNPADLYGVSKCFGEALGRYMAEQEGLSTIAIRIGAYQTIEDAHAPDGAWLLDILATPRDLNHLFMSSIEAENVRFALLHGVSDNRFNRLDLTSTRAAVGYRPQDDAAAGNPAFGGLDLGAALRSHSPRDPHQQSGLRDDLTS